MLPIYYRFRLYWVADNTLTYDSDARVGITFRKWKLTSTGALVYSAEVSDDFGFSAGETIVTTGQVESTVVDNSVDLYMGLHGTLEVTADVSGTDGTMYLYVEESTDNVDWPSDQADFDITDLTLICAMAMSTDAVDEDRAKNFQFG